MSVSTRGRASSAAGLVASAFGRRPWWMQVLVLYGAARFVTFCIFVAVARQQGPSPWGPARPGYLDFIGIWDGAWYQQIYAEGYPDAIPRGADGSAQQNQWAFYALFPFVVRGLHLATTLDWRILAPLVATVAGFAAALVWYRLFREFTGHRTALWAVVLAANFPVAAVLQVPYAESLNLLLLAAALLMVVRRNYGAAIPATVLMCLSRPTGPAFTILIVVLMICRFVSRRTDRFETRERWSMAALLAATAAATAAWPVAAWIVTGEPTAYTDTETAWRAGGLVLFEPWFGAGARLFGPLLGPLAALAAVAAFVLLMRTAPVRRIGLELRVWCYAYMGYLFAFLHPQTSTFRMLLPLFPLALAAVCVSTSRAYRGCVLLMFLLLQIVWVAWLWQWTELPGGGDYPP